MCSKNIWSIRTKEVLMVGDAVFNILRSIAIISLYIVAYKFLITLAIFAGYFTPLSIALAILCFIHLYK